MVIFYALLLATFGLRTKAGLGNIHLLEVLIMIAAFPFYCFCLFVWVNATHKINFNPVIWRQK